jgi:hypothetical protein
MGNKAAIDGLDDKESRNRIRGCRVPGNPLILMVSRDGIEPSTY